MQQDNAIIRKYEPRDREAVREIIHDTAFIGEPADAFFEGRKLISDALTLYYTDYEPESSFVAEIDGVVGGCLIGAKDKKASEKIIGNKIMPHLLWQALVSGAFFRIKNIRFICAGLSSVMGAEFRMPEVAGIYPATFHINLKKEFRGLGIGSRLIGSYLDYLRKEGVRGVHLATMSDGAGNFFSSNGFQLLHAGKRSYFRHIINKDVPLYIYGMKL